LTKKRVKPNTAPEAVAPALPAESALAIFSGRRAWLWAFLFLAIGCGRIVSTYNVFATTSDEPAHIACGMEYVANHTYKLETQHPPFTRAMMALLPYLDGVRPRGLSNFQNEGWAILTYQHHAARTLFLARMGNLPFFMLGGLVVFFCIGYGSQFAFDTM